MNALIEAAAAGNRPALDSLLLREYDALLAFIRYRMPASMTSRVSVEDLLQDTLLHAAKSIRGFAPTSDVSGFRAWLHTIAQNVIRDAIKSNQAARRDARRDVPAQRSAPDESCLGLLDLLPVSARTPSQSVARQQAAAAVRMALASIPNDYREAIQLRYIEGLSVGQIAVQMNRTDRAIHMLCNRGLKALAEAMGSPSMFLSWKA